MKMVVSIRLLYIIATLNNLTLYLGFKAFLTIWYISICKPFYTKIIY